VNLPRDDLLANERELATGGHRYVRDAGHGAHPQGVARDLREGLVPGHGSDGDELDRRASMGEQDCDGVVVARVAVEDDLAGHGFSLVSGS
jgi:hypothetical protein